MDTSALETAIANMLALTIGCFALYRFTAKWRRQRSMKKLAYELDCDYKPKDDSLLDQYDKFLTIQVGHQPRVTNVLSRQDGDISVCIFDITYLVQERLKNALKGPVRRRTTFALTHPGMTLPHFYIRPETTVDKIRARFQGTIDAFGQFKEGLHAVTGKRLKELDDHLNRPPNIKDWFNRDEIELPHNKQFSDAHWIKGHDSEATENFLSDPILTRIEAESNLIWEGFDTMFLLSGTQDSISPKEIAHYLGVAREFINTALASSKSNAA